MLKSLVTKLALWALGKTGHVRHLGKGNSIVLKDRFGREVFFKVAPPNNALWEDGCTCREAGEVRRDCPFHYLPKVAAVYVRLK